MVFGLSSSSFLKAILRPSETGSYNTIARPKNNVDPAMLQVYVIAMNLLRTLPVLLAAAFSTLSNPFAEAERTFLQELNSMDGIELAGGPFHAGEQHHFEGEFGYFILAPAVSIPSIDQRLSVQTKLLHASVRSNSLPIAAWNYTREGSLEPGDRHKIEVLLAQHGFGQSRDQITAFDLSTIQVRPVIHLPLLKMITPTPKTAIALLGAQTWQGIPLYRAAFDRTRGDFELESLRESFFPRRRHEIALRQPILSPQTFFAERGLNRADWIKLLRNFSPLDLPAIPIIEAAVSDRLVTLYADIQLPVLPQFWVKLEKAGSNWKLIQAVEFRAEFPRPGAWWTFLPLLPEKAANSVLSESAAPIAAPREVETIVTHLRGVGQITSLASTNDNSAVRVRTTHDQWRGYDLEFRRKQNSWRFTSVVEWTE